MEIQFNVTNHQHFAYAFDDPDKYPDLLGSRLRLHRLLQGPEPPDEERDHRPDGVSAVHREGGGLSALSIAGENLGPALVRKTDVRMGGNGL